jgi:uncharacterized protein (DUF1499 family)
MRKFMTYLAALILVAGVAGAVLLFTPLGARPLTALFPVGEVAPVDFTALKLTGNPNQHLVCPPDFCAAAPHAFSPVFDIPVDRLRARWQAVVAAQPRVALLAEYDGGMQIDFVQRSARFRFPDIVTVRFIPVPPAQSTLAIYSRSLYGRSDLGVNRARVEAWVSQLRQQP